MSPHVPNAELARLVRRFARRRVLVLGEAILDSYLDGSVRRLSREAPVPLVNLEARRDVPGGAANTAVNLASLGARVVLLSVVGRDGEGTRLRGALAARGVDAHDLIACEGRTTLAKHRLVADGQMVVRFDQGSLDALDAATETELVAALRDRWREAEAVVVSDYAGGIVTERVLRALGQLQAADPRVLTVDARHLARYRPVGATAVKPNHAEASELLGQAPQQPGPERVEALRPLGAGLLDRSGAKVVAATLDRDGTLVFERGRAPYRTAPRPQASNAKATGAGDTFTAALTLALCAHASGAEAAELGAAAAAVAIAKDGTAACTAGELAGAVAAEGKRVDDLEELAARAQIHRDAGGRVVLANGVFDILHRGHTVLLREARALGDVLVVAVNADASVRRLKGPGRPVNSLEDRLGVLAALDHVDLVVAFEGDTAADVIHALRPDVLVKGADHRREVLPEGPLVEELGGRVEILPLLDDRSTSGIIERVRGPRTGALP